MLLCSSDRLFITLEAERADFQMSNRTVLLGQFLNTLTTSRLANRNDHSILTPHIAGIGFFLANLANVLQCGTIELDYLLAHNITLMVGHAVDVIGIFRDSIIGNFHEHRHCDTLEDHTGLTLGIFDDWILGFHFLFSLRSIVLLCVHYTKRILLCQPYNTVRISNSLSQQSQRFPPSVRTTHTLPSS